MGYKKEKNWTVTDEINHYNKWICRAKNRISVIEILINTAIESNYLLDSEKKGLVKEWVNCKYLLYQKFELYYFWAIKKRYTYINKFLVKFTTSLNKVNKNNGKFSNIKFK